MPVYVLDTTTLTHLQQAHPRLLFRFNTARQAGDPVGTTTVSVGEVVEGWTNRIRRAKSPAEEARFSARLADSTRAFAHLLIHPVTVPALAHFDALVKLKLNVGRSDLKIAAVALDLGATVVTDNLRDFGRVPRLGVEDWLV
jgi:tRNA(fMet)-specific endonuclease VapC